MKVAITVWDKRVSPVFDCAKRCLIFNIDNHSNENNDSYAYEHIPEFNKCEYFCNMGVELIICGAISMCQKSFLNSKGIEVDSFITGDIDTIVSCYKKGIKLDGNFFLPGCLKMRRRRHCGKYNKPI